MRGWSELRVLGSDGFVKVLLAQDPETGEHFVVKQIQEPFAAEQKERVLREAAHLHALRHPGIVAFREAAERDGLLCLVTDYADGGDLGKFLHKQGEIGDLLPEGQVLRWLAQLCTALGHLHDRHVVHRNLKASNIFLRRLSREVQLGDIGISTLLDLRDSTTGFSTNGCSPCYWSPERVLRRHCGAPADIWSLGVLAYELCALRRPFEAASFEALGDLILGGDVPPLDQRRYSQDLRAATASMLSRAPEARPRACDLQELQLLRAAAFGPPPRLPPMMARPVVDSGIEAVELLESTSSMTTVMGAGVGNLKAGGQGRAAWSVGESQHNKANIAGSCSSEVRPCTPDVFRPVTPDDIQMRQLAAPKFRGSAAGTLLSGFPEELQTLPGGLPMVELLDEDEDVQSLCTENLDGGVRNPKAAWGAAAASGPWKPDAQDAAAREAAERKEAAFVPPAALAIAEAQQQQEQLLANQQQLMVSPPQPRQGGLGKAIFRGARRLLGLGPGSGGEARIAVGVSGRAGPCSEQY